MNKTYNNTKIIPLDCTKMFTNVTIKVFNNFKEEKIRVRMNAIHSVVYNVSTVTAVTLYCCVRYSYHDAGAFTVHTNTCEVVPHIFFEEHNQKWLTHLTWLL